MNFRVTTILFGVMLALGLVLLGLSFLQTDSTGATDVLVEELAKNAVKPDQITEVAPGSSLSGPGKIDGILSSPTQPGPTPSQ